MTRILLRRGEDTGTQGEGHMKMEAETGAMQSQAKDLEPPEARRDEEGSFSGDFIGGMTLPTPHFPTAGLQNYEINFLLF